MQSIETVPQQEKELQKTDASGLSSANKTTTENTPPTNTTQLAKLHQELVMKQETGNKAFIDEDDDGYGDELDEDFDMEDIQMMDKDAANQFFDEDMEGEEVQAAKASLKATAALFEASHMPAMVRDNIVKENANTGDHSMECKDESLDDMLDEQRKILERSGAIKVKRKPMPPNQPFQHQMLVRPGENVPMPHASVPMPGNSLPYNAYLPSHQNQIAQAHQQGIPLNHIFREGDAAHFKREVEYELILPFRTKRVEKINNNGEKKQAKLEIRKRMMNERVKMRQRLISMKKIEAIKELISKGELAPDALRWKMRKTGDQKEQARYLEGRKRKAEKLRKIRESGVECKSEDEKTEDNLPPIVQTLGDEDRPFMVKKNGEPRNLPCRWTMSEHSTLVQMLKSEGKAWKEIADAIGSKNEQQCRTRGLILFNKLKLNCWDQKLYDILKPSGRALNKPIELDDQGNPVINQAEIEEKVKTEKEKAKKARKPRPPKKGKTSPTKETDPDPLEDIPGITSTIDELDDTKDKDIDDAIAEESDEDPDDKKKDATFHCTFKKKLIDGQLRKSGRQDGKQTPQKEILKRDAKNIDKQKQREERQIVISQTKKQIQMQRKERLEEKKRQMSEKIKVQKKPKSNDLPRRSKSAASSKCMTDHITGRAFLPGKALIFQKKYEDGIPLFEEHVIDENDDTTQRSSESSFSLVNKDKKSSKPKTVSATPRPPNRPPARAASLTPKNKNRAATPESSSEEDIPRVTKIVKKKVQPKQKVVKPEPKNSIETERKLDELQAKKEMLQQKKDLLRQKLEQQQKQKEVTQVQSSGLSRSRAAKTNAQANITATRESRQSDPPQNLRSRPRLTQLRSSIDQSGGPSSGLQRSILIRRPALKKLTTGKA